MLMLPAFTGAPQLNRVYHCDALTLLKALPDASVDLILTDPPYMGVKKEAWDNQWDSVDAFIAWLDGILREYRRVLKPNGSLYLFCATELADDVGIAVRQHFNVLSRITWRKSAGWHNKASEETIRSFFPQTERVIFAEQYGADGAALMLDGSFLFEPLRVYLDGERIKANVSFDDVRGYVGCAPGSGLPSHWFTRSQWILPTREQYEKLQCGFRLKHGDSLKREYGSLKREYDARRRPFFADASRPYTDVWEYKTVASYPGKHVCEKPLDMMRDIIETSSRPGDVVLDTFVGSGNSLRAAKELGRNWLGCDTDRHWVTKANHRIDAPVYEQLSMFETLAQENAA